MLRIIIIIIVIIIRHSVGLYIFSVTTVKNTIFGDVAQ
jgi:hypothetical protein